MNRLVVFQWPISTFFGWGVYGLNLALHMREAAARAVSSAPVRMERIVIDEIRRRLLADSFAVNARLVADLAGWAGKEIETDSLVLHALGNQFEFACLSAHDSVVKGRPTVGVVFFEDTELGRKGLARARGYRLLIAGSNWNGAVLTAAGLGPVSVVLQGVDTTLFHPAPRAGFLDGRFAVFSGGKLEYRKGQDLVLRAFKAFHGRHPEALLVTAWQSPWPQVARTLDGPHLPPVPVTAGGVDVAGWVAAAGVPPGAVVDLGSVPNALMPPILREMDVAVFPNRSEGGTNLVAMETMACGVPTILAANTGQLDLIRPGNCYPLSRQPPVSPPPAARITGTDGWGESDVEEILEALEAVYQDRAAARARGLAGAETLMGLSWQVQIGALTDILAANFWK